MIKREGLRIIITCDGCGVIREDQEGRHAKWRSYPDVWKEASAEGWTAKKNDKGTDFDRYCRECSR